jgi:hypothetical protein
MPWTPPSTSTATPARSVSQDTTPRGSCDALMACVVLLSPVLSPAPARAETPQGCLDSKWIKEVAHFVAVETRSQVPEVCVRFALQEQLNGLVPSALAGEGSWRDRRCCLCFRDP